MKIMKIQIVVAVAFLLFASSAMAHGSKVGFVNPQRIISESRIGQIAQDDLARLGKEKDRRVREALEQVEVVKRQLGKKTLTAAEEQSLETSMRLAVRNYEKMVETGNMDIQGEERRLIEFVMRRADSILRRIAMEMGFTMILTDPEVIGFVDNSLDITDRVIRELNSMI